MNCEIGQGSPVAVGLDGDIDRKVSSLRFIQVCAHTQVEHAAGDMLESRDRSEPACPSQPCSLSFMRRQSTVHKERAFD